MKIGPYELQGEVGRGGTGVVFKARAEDGRAVALKLLLDAKPERRARFERERRLLATLGEEEGFVPLLDAGEVPRGPYVVMPFLEGGTLRKRLASGALGVDEVLTLGPRLATAIGLAHERGVVHRDLKPENVLYTATGRPLIADLGLAKHFDRDAPGASRSASVSTGGLAAGTLGYMAPEQMNDAKRVGPPADVFALGAILYECLAGRPAFDGDNGLEVAHKVAESSVTAIGRFRPETPRWLGAVVMKCLSADPARRFTDGRALARALVPPLAGSRSVAGVALGVGAGVLLLGAAGALLVRKAAPPPPPPAPAPPPRAPVESVDEILRRAEEKMSKRDHAGALADATLATKRDPACSPAWVVKAIAEAGKDRGGALVDLSRAIQLDSKNARAYYVRGIIERNSNEVDPACDDLRRATELAPGWAAAWGARGIARVAKGELDGAIDDLTRAIELGEKDAEPLLERGRARQLKGDHKAALADFTKAIELEPRNAFAWTISGNARVFLGDYKGAITDTSQALALDPYQYKAWCDRGLARVATNDFENAITDCDRAVEIAPGYAVAWDTRGTAKLRAGDNKGAIEDFTKALSIDPELASSWGNLGSALLANGDVAGAIEKYERFLAVAPSDPSAPKVREQLERVKASRKR